MHECLSFNPWNSHKSLMESISISRCYYSKIGSGEEKWTGAVEIVSLVYAGPCIEQQEVLFQTRQKAMKST